MSHSINISRIKGVYNALGALKDEVVFVGGATVSLYADNPDDADSRPTDDIDVLVEIATYTAYTQIQERLNALGFKLDTTSKVTCRYIYQGLTVDVMPLHADVLGFSNKWYQEGFAKRIKFTADEHATINIFSAPYFIASKFEAFKGRGENDGRTSTDFEDIVFVLDNRKKIWEEIKQCDVALYQYLRDVFIILLAIPYVEEWLTCHLEPKFADKRAAMILENMGAL